MSETAIEPSPTALATRLIERARTSPATNTPGTVVSSRYGSRFSGQPAACGVGPGEDEPALVARDDAVEPVGARRRADEDEARVDVHRSLLAVGVADAQAREVAVLALAPRSRVPVRTSTLRQRRDLLDEVVRHRLLERVPRTSIVTRLA